MLRRHRATWIVLTLGLSAILSPQPSFAQVELLVNGGLEDGAGSGWEQSSTNGLDNILSRWDLALTGT